MDVLYIYLWRRIVVNQSKQPAWWLLQVEKSVADLNPKKPGFLKGKTSTKIIRKSYLNFL